MRSASADTRLPGARRVALLLFCCSVVLPTIVVLRRGGGAFYSSDDSSALDDGEIDLGSPLLERAAAQQKRGASARQKRTAVPGVEGTRVLVFVTLEQANTVELHVRKDASSGVADVCSGTSLADESYAAAAERVLWACASLRPPPDVEFLERAGEEPAPGAAVPFVALVRTERLLRGGSTAPKVRLHCCSCCAARSHCAARSALSLCRCNRWLTKWRRA